MLCNWCDSQQLIKEWSNMILEQDKYNLEFTLSDENIDYYIIINKPFNEKEYYIPEKTIVYQMEPYINDINKKWGTKTWDTWACPDKEKFMHVHIHKNYLNNVQWQINIPNSIPDVRKDKIISILSNKYFDEGHIKRVNFIKYMEEKNKNQINIYGKENYFRFNNYQGILIDDKKEKCYINYKYCFAVENNEEYNYATEKIWEPILCECLAFYWGCPNLEEYIDSRAFVRLDLNDFEGSLNIINQAIEENWWHQRIDIIRKEKEKIINKLAFLPILNNILNNKPLYEKKY